MITSINVGETLSPGYEPEIKETLKGSNKETIQADMFWEGAAKRIEKTRS